MSNVLVASLDSYCENGAALRYRTAVVLVSALAACLSYVPDPVVRAMAASLALGAGLWIGSRPTLRSLMALAVLLVPLSLFPAGGLSDSFAPFYMEGVTFGFGGGCALLATRRGLFGYRSGLMPPSVTIYARVWAVAMLLAGIAGVWGYVLGNNAFSASVRYSLVASSFIWGAHLNVPWRSFGPEIASRAKWLVTVVAAMLVLPSVVGGHGIFVIAGICASMGIRSSKDGGRFAFAVAPLVVALLIGARHTLTVLGVVAVAVVMSYIGSRTFYRYRRGLTYGAIAVLTMLAGTVVAISITQGSDVALPLQTENLRRAAESKILYDRGPLWRAAVRELGDGGNLLRPSGNMLTVYGFPNSRLGYQEWVGGAHNTVLQTALTGGWLFALAMTGLAWIAVAAAAKALVAVGHSLWWVTVLAAAGIALMMTGSLTGQFVVEPAAGFWIWTILGATAAAPTRVKVRSLRGACSCEW